MNINELRTERDQLAARIAEIDALIAAEVQAATSTYTVTETTSPHGSTMYHVVRTDGTEDRRTKSYSRRDRAELHAEFCERTPRHYRISLETPPSNRMDKNQYWRIYGSRQNDPKSLNCEFKTNQQVHGNWPEGTRLVDLLVHFTLQHEDGADARIAAETDANKTKAADSDVREARAAAQHAEGPLATKRQVDLILKLLAQREFNGEGGGFFYGPTDRAGIELLSRAKASTYITSLKGDY